MLALPISSLPLWCCVTCTIVRLRKRALSVLLFRVLSVKAYHAKHPVVPSGGLDQNRSSGPTNTSP